MTTWCVESCSRSVAHDVWTPWSRKALLDRDEQVEPDLLIAKVLSIGLDEVGAVEVLGPILSSARAVQVTARVASS